MALLLASDSLKRLSDVGMQARCVAKGWVKNRFHATSTCLVSPCSPQHSRVAPIIVCLPGRGQSDAHSFRCSPGLRTNVGACPTAGALCPITPTRLTGSGRLPTLVPLDAVKPGRKVMTRAMLRTTRAVVLLAVVAASLSSAAFGQADQRKLVSTATLTLSGFLNDPDMHWLRNNINRAKAVLIAPTITKAGFIIGGSGGRAVVVARNAKTGKWAGPAFYVLVTGSVGFQAGVSVSETVSLVMTEKGLDSLLSSSFKFGGDVSVAAGPIGTGAQSNMLVDFISFSRSKGIYGGLSLDGTVVSTADAWNRAYYGRAVNPRDFLVRESVHNKQANELINVVAAAAKKT